VIKSYHFYTKDADYFFDKIEWVDVDFHDHKSLYSSLKDVSEVYHCAAKVSFDPNDSEEVLETGILTTRNLLQACMDLHVKKFLYVSTASCFSVKKRDLQLQIKDKCNHKKYSDYVVSKYVSENLVWSAYKEGLNAMIINPGLIIGTGNWSKDNSQMLDIFLKSRFTFSGGASCVDVRDVTKIAIRLMEKNIFGERFFIASQNILYKDLAVQVRKKMGLPKPIVCPKIFLKSILFFRNILWIFNRNAKFLTPENIEFVSEKQFYHSKILNDKIPNYSFYSVSESINFHYGNYLKSKNSKKSII
jgi:nucleoside-diphosphate-sugar epimerase